jgi:cyclophilin family peptidyl-prolyl cis-trans isomerase
MSPQNRQRGREAAHRRAAQVAAREQARRKQRRTRAIVIGVVAVVVVLAIGLSLVPGSNNDGTPDAATTTTLDPFAESTSSTTTPVEPAEFTYGTGECAPERKPEARPDTFAASPQRCLKPDTDYRAVIGTSEGTFTVDLLEDTAPGTVNNFVQLAKWGWYDGDDFHRVVPGFVNQAGDPVGEPPGTGGPGYTIADELPAAVTEYIPGTVAMANSGPNTNGSQWFVCIDCSVLPTAGYSIFGQVTDGMEVVEAINALGTSDGPPSTPVTIVAVEILEGDPLEGEG